MTSSLIKNNCESSERFEHVMDIWSRLSGGIEKIGFNNPVYLSEKNTADRNYALAYFMKEKNHVKKIGFPDNTNLHETMELYFQCCSIEVNTQIMSIVGQQNSSYKGESGRIPFMDGNRTLPFYPRY